MCSKDNSNELGHSENSDTVQYLFFPEHALPHFKFMDIMK